MYDVIAYLNRTISLRAKAVKQGLGKPTQPFLSWSTHRPVTKTTISCWLTTTLEMAGINTQLFTAHSYRGAGLSDTKAKGASVSQIVAAGYWTNVKTFHSFYEAPANNTPIGKIILDHYQQSVSHCSVISILTRLKLVNIITTF